RRVGFELLRQSRRNGSLAHFAAHMGSIVPFAGTLDSAGARAIDRRGDAPGRGGDRTAAFAGARWMESMDGHTGGVRSDPRGLHVGLARGSPRWLAAPVSVVDLRARRTDWNRVARCGFAAGTGR